MAAKHSAKELDDAMSDSPDGVTPEYRQQEVAAKDTLAALEVEAQRCKDMDVKVGLRWSELV